MYAEANTLFEKKEMKAAEALYRKVLTIDPQFAPAYNNLGLVASTDEARIKDAILYFMQAIKCDPYYADAFANLGIICDRIGNYDRAEKYLQHAIELDPSNAKYLFSLGWVYVSGMKNYRKGIEILDAYVAMDSDNADAHYLLGMAYIDTGKKEKVFEEITALRQLNQEALAAALEEMIRTPYTAGNAQKTPHTAVKMNYDVTMVPRGMDAKALASPVPSPGVIGKGTMTGTIAPTAGPARISGNMPPTKRKARIKGTTGSPQGQATGSGTIQLKLSGNVTS